MTHEGVIYIMLLEKIRPHGLYVFLYINDIQYGIYDAGT